MFLLSIHGQNAKKITEPPSRELYPNRCLGAKQDTVSITNLTQNGSLTITLQRFDALK